MAVTVIMTDIMMAMVIDMMTEALTYKEIAERLNIKLTSARRTAMRKKWQRIKGNDGTVKVLVPVEDLQRPDDKHDDRPNDSHNVVNELQMRVQHLQELLASEQKRAASAELDRDRWYELAVRPWWKRLAG